MLLSRYTASGALDPTFGMSGVVRGGIGGETVIDVALQPDGKIVAAVDSSYGIFITRYRADGTLDDTFFGSVGHGRTFLTLAAGTEGQGGLVRQQEDGSIVAGGALDSAHRFALQRVYETGWPDSAFGAFFGYCLAPIGLDDDAELWDVARLPDGKFIAVGSASSGGQTDFAVARFDADGCPDLTFGANGAVITSLLPGADERARAVTVQPDGKIDVLGDTGGNTSAFAVVRYLPDGSLDPTFGDAGIALVPVGLVDVARDLVTSADGTFVIGGQADGLFTIVRLGPAGDVDPTFGTHGVVQIAQAPFAPCCSELFALALQPDGRVVAAGRSVVDLPGAGFDLALARLLGGQCGNGRLEFGETCDDGNQDGGGCCSPGCLLEPPGTACDDDGFRCTSDMCDSAGACTHRIAAPPACRTSRAARGAKVAIEENADGRRNGLTWSWRKGEAIARAELGDPTTTTGYVLCAAADSTLLFELDAPPGGTCGGKPCWKTSAAAVRYRSSDVHGTGSVRLRVTAGAAGKSRALAKGKGAALSLPALPLPDAVRVQLRGDTGLCIDSVFSIPLRNDAKRYEARSEH